jgi:Spy/CpxP family protein refolding chaperone
MKLGWIGALALGSVVALQPLAQAQEKKDEKPAAPAAAPPLTPAAPAAPLSSAEIRSRQTEASLNGMTRMYSLTDEQKAKVKPILEEQFKKLEELRLEKTVAPEERRKKLLDIREASQTKIKALLTPEQLQKMDSLRQRGQVRPAPGAPGATPAAPPAPPK